MGISTGSGALYGVTGGVTESVLRQALPLCDIKLKAGTGGTRCIVALVLLCHLSGCKALARLLAPHWRNLVSTSLQDGVRAVLLGSGWTSWSVIVSCF